jgi:hypothetical protein
MEVGDSMLYLLLPVLRTGWRVVRLLPAPVPVVMGVRVIMELGGGGRLLLRLLFWGHWPGFLSFCRTSHDELMMLKALVA